MIEIRGGQIHVWRASLHRPELYARFLELLSPDEQERAERYHAERHRWRFVASRAIQRDVLAGYLGVSPGDLEFSYSSHGKPALAGDWVDSGLNFNLSNSGDLMACAVRRGPPLGVDIEEIRALPAADAIADRFFSAADVATIRSLEGPARERTFFASWVRTEAVIKAMGETVWRTLAVASEGASDERASHPSRGSEWQTRDLELGQGFVGALAIEADASPTIEYRDWVAGLTL